MNFQTTAAFDFLMAKKKVLFSLLAKNGLFYSYSMTCNAMGGRVDWKLSSMIVNHVTSALFTVTNPARNKYLGS